MNRPIKFRVRCNSGDKPFHYFYVPTAYLEMALEMYDLETTGLFTGITDKNGKEIYEGDLLACTDGTRPWTTHVQFDIERGAYHRVEDYPHGEVIGNIYENPELLAA